MVNVRIELKFDNRKQAMSFLKEFKNHFGNIKYKFGGYD